MSNSANFRQNAEQTQALNKLNSLMSSHSTSQSSTNASVDALKTLQTKTFTPAVAPAESVITATEKQFTMLGGVNHMGGSFNKINPVKVDNNGEVAVNNGSFGHLTTIASNTADGSTATLQGTANGHLQTIADNSELKGYTDITDSSSAVRLSAENGGKLQVQVVGSNDINGGTPHRHLTIDSNGRTLTNPIMTATNNILTTINTNTLPVRASTHTTNVAGLSANTAGTTYDLGTDYYRYRVLRIIVDMVASPPNHLYIQESDDGVSWAWVEGIMLMNLQGGGQTTNFGTMHIDRPLRYWRFYNNDSVSATNTIDNLWTIASYI